MTTLATQADPPADTAQPPSVPITAAAPRQRQHGVVRWLLDDSPYIAMLALALCGVLLRLPVGYWVILTPVYGVICIIAGWRHFTTSQEHLQLVYSQALNWAALCVAVYLLYADGVQGVLNANSSSLAMMTLLALGTFVAGVQARLWRTCAVGALLFVAVPAVGWLDQSAMLLLAATAAVIAIGAFVWWLDQREHAMP